MLNQNMRIVSQDDRYNLPYSLITIFIYKTEIYAHIYAHMINGEEYLLGTYSTEEKARYIFGQILVWTQNYYKLPKDERVDLDNLDLDLDNLDLDLDNLD